MSEKETKSVGGGRPPVSDLSVGGGRPPVSDLDVSVSEAEESDK